jgi:hypothetical protein
VKVGAAEIKKDVDIVVVWKRGPEQQQSQTIELNEYEIDADLTEVFTKVSSFYSKDNVTYEGKYCNIVIKSLNGAD